MLTIPRLNDAQLSHFDQNGFVVTRSSFNEAETSLIQKWTSELSALPEESGKHWIYKEPSLFDENANIINRIENIRPFHEGFASLAQILKSSVGQLFGEEAILFKDKINYKMPGGDGFKPHQDAQAGWEQYANYFITVMVCIDSASLENGCLQIARRPDAQLVGSEWEPLTETQTATMQFNPIPTEPGDIIYFDSYVPHFSEPNLTNECRRLYFATYNPFAEGDNLNKYFEDKRKSYPPDIDREVGESYVYRV